MKELTIKVYSFDELSKEVQDKIIERERWDVMDNAMECYYEVQNCFLHLRVRGCERSVGQVNAYVTLCLP